MNKPPIFVFVYGTLKQGHRNHHILSDHQPRFIGQGVTISNKFNMIIQESSSSHGKFTPGVYKSYNDGYFISGEVYEVSDICFKKLDELEKIGINYTREQIEISSNGENYKAWIYLKIEIGQSIDDASYVTCENRTLSWDHKG